MKKRLNILLVEDDPGDVEITLEVLKLNNLRINIRVAESGQEALDCLNGVGCKDYRPDLILLDLNMPGMNGKEVLSEIKKDGSLRDIPVIVVTTSESEDDVSYSYHTGASCYITKPRGLQEYSSMLKALEEFWLNCVRFPSVN